jgi:alkanesulfonate monooxygenase SsuD/methylene tetrahydromethanopterin reductase-like flavin-dependent oxidoreductase (luciferase family)
MSARGFGVAGAVPHEIIQELAQAAEQSGFATFWVNDTPQGDGLAALAAAAGVTTRIGLGVGVIAVDRQPGAVIARRITELDLPESRLIVGIGSGGAMHGTVEIVRTAIGAIRPASKARIVVGALGPRMCRLGGESADGVLLNWLTPGPATISAQAIHEAAANAGRRNAHVAGYVRTALGEAALPKLQAEANRYEGIPNYARHFARMGIRAFDTAVLGESRTEIAATLGKFEEAWDETVVRAITANDSAEEYLALLEATAPNL